MTSIRPTRFADHRAMLLAGVRRVHAFASAPSDIPLQWRDLEKLGMPPGQRGKTRYGAICGASVQEQRMEYMCAVEVESLADVPPEYGRMRVPEQHYAVFTHEGPASTIHQTWDAIWANWLPRSGCEPAQTPDFEVYDERFDPHTGSGIVEIWVPVKRR